MHSAQSVRPSGTLPLYERKSRVPNPARCKVCNHRPGVRSTNNMAASDKKPYDHGTQPKKAPCAHECHV